MKKNDIKKFAALLLCCGLAFLTLPAWAAEPAKPDTNESGMPLIPDFTLPSNTGEDITLSGFEGRQVVLYLWATWCPACVQGMPDKQAVYDWMLENDFPGEVWAVNLTDGIRETRATADAFMESNGFTLPMLYDVDGELFGWTQSRYVPVTMVIDGEGYLKGGAVGSLSMEEIVALLEKDM